MHEFIDYDFTKDPRYVPGDLGLGDAGQLCGVYDDSEEIMEWSEIDAEIEKLDAVGGGADQLVTRIYDQGREGSCVANAFSQSNEIVQALQFGRDKVVPLSAISLYKRIGRSPGSGAMVSDGIKEMVRRGILPLDNAANRQRFKHVMPATGFYTPFPSGWEETAALFRGHEYKIARSSKAVFTALVKQRPVVVGRAGHSIVYVRPMRRNGARVAKYPNSWSEGWGDRGFGYDTARYFESASSWAVVVMTTVNPIQRPIPTA